MTKCMASRLVKTVLIDTGAREVGEVCSGTWIVVGYGIPWVEYSRFADRVLGTDFTFNTILGCGSKVTPCHRKHAFAFTLLTVSLLTAHHGFFPLSSTF